MVASDRRRITGCKAVRKKREPLRYGAAKPSRTRLCFDWPRSCVMAGLGLKLQPTRTCGPKIPQWSCVAPETWGLLMLRLLIGLARLDLCKFLRWATSPGVAMQITQFWTVSIMLPPASSGTHRPTATESCCLQTIGRLQAEHTGRVLRKVPSRVIHRHRSTSFPGSGHQCTWERVDNRQTEVSMFRGDNSYTHTSRERCDSGVGSPASTENGCSAFVRFRRSRTDSRGGHVVAHSHTPHNSRQPVLLWKGKRDRLQTLCRRSSRVSHISLYCLWYGSRALPI